MFGRKKTPEQRAAEAAAEATRAAQAATDAAAAQQQAEQEAANAKAAAAKREQQEREAREAARAEQEAKAAALKTAKAELAKDPNNEEKKFAVLELEKPKKAAKIKKKKAAVQAEADAQAKKRAMWKDMDARAAKEAEQQAAKDKERQQAESAARAQQAREEAAARAAEAAAKERARQEAVLRELDKDIEQTSTAMGVKGFDAQRAEARAAVIAQEEADDAEAKAKNLPYEQKGKRGPYKVHETERKVLHALGYETEREQSSDIAWLKQHHAMTPIAYLKTVSSVRQTARMEAIKTKDPAYKAELKERGAAAESMMRQFVVDSLPALSKSLERETYFKACPGLRAMYQEEKAKADAAAIAAQDAARQEKTDARVQQEKDTLKAIDEAIEAGKAAEALAMTQQALRAEGNSSPSATYKPELTARYSSLTTQVEQQTNESRPAILGKVTRAINKAGKKETLAEKIDGLEEARDVVMQTLAVTKDPDFRATLNQRANDITAAEFEAATARQTWNGEVALNAPGVAEAVLGKHPTLTHMFADVVANAQTAPAQPQPKAAAKKQAVPTPA